MLWKLFLICFSILNALFQSLSISALFSIIGTLTASTMAIVQYIWLIILVHCLKMFLILSLLNNLLRRAWLIGLKHWRRQFYTQVHRFKILKLDLLQLVIQIINGFVLHHCLTMVLIIHGNKFRLILEEYGTVLMEI